MTDATRANRLSDEAIERLFTDLECETDLNIIGIDLSLALTELRDRRAADQANAADAESAWEEIVRRANEMLAAGSEVTNPPPKEWYCAGFEAGLLQRNPPC